MLILVALYKGRVDVFQKQDASEGHLSKILLQRVVIERRIGKTAHAKIKIHLSGESEGEGALPIARRAVQEDPSAVRNASNAVPPLRFEELLDVLEEVLEESRAEVDRCKASLLDRHDLPPVSVAIPGRLEDEGLAVFVSEGADHRLRCQLLEDTDVGADCRQFESLVEFETVLASSHRELILLNGASDADVSALILDEVKSRSRGEGEARLLDAGAASFLSFSDETKVPGVVGLVHLG